MARGGRRQGRTGASYSNRSDLQTGPRLPVQVAPGQVYGAGAQQRRAQQAVPLRGPAAAPSRIATAGASQPTPPPPPLTAPTERPDEPLTAGVIPPSLTAPQVAPPNIAQEDAEALRSRLPLLEYLASQPGSTPSTRMLALRVRSMLGG